MNASFGRNYQAEKSIGIRDLGLDCRAVVWMRTTSNRELARQIGVSETAVRRAEKAGRIRREPDGAWDLARVKAPGRATPIGRSSAARRQGAR